MLRAVADGLLAVVLAPACAACRHPLDSPTRAVVCDTCWKSIRPITPPFCAVCGESLRSWRSAHDDERCLHCRNGHTPIARGRTVGEYDGVLRTILHALKYEGRKSIAPVLSALMRAQGQSVLSDADFVVPVPLHWRRQWARGFNQAADLAVGLGLTVVHALRRCRNTPSQTDLPAAARHANVRRAFSVRPGTDVTGSNIVLVDDVRTTGATLEACARALLDAGARQVMTLTAAQVVTQQPASRPR
jgi:ComF family protein